MVDGYLSMTLLNNIWCEGGELQVVSAAGVRGVLHLLAAVFGRVLVVDGDVVHHPLLVSSLVTDHHIQQRPGVNLYNICSTFRKYFPEKYLRSAPARPLSGGSTPPPGGCPPRG